MSDLGVFGLEFENIFVIYDQRPQICLVAKFGAKIKIPKFETKNV